MADRTEERLDEKIREAFGTLEPDEDQKNRIWAQIGAATKSTDADYTSAKAAAASKGVASGAHKTARRIIAAAAAVAVVFGGFKIAGGGLDSLIGSGSGSAGVTTQVVYAHESLDTGLSYEEVLVETALPNYQKIYAPEIYYLDDDTLIFGDCTGTIIYDRSAESVKGIIDMQAIGSAYAGGDTMDTNMYVEDGKLIVYNTEGGEPFGYYHVYDLANLTAGDDGILKADDIGDDADTLAAYVAKGTEITETQYVDAWDTREETIGKFWDDYAGNDDIYSYSQFAYIWSDESGNEHWSVITSAYYGEGGSAAYALNTVDEDGTDITKAAEVLNLGIDEAMVAKVREMNELPDYEYTGDDAALATIIKAQKDEDWFPVTDAETSVYDIVMINTPDVYLETEEDGELLVYGDFWEQSYFRQGNTLVSNAGGSFPACYHLVKSDSSDTGYEVASVERPEEGELYEESVKEMCKGHAGLASKFLNNGYENIDVVGYVRDYVESNDLEIEYIKDMFWDPVSLAD